MLTILHLMPCYMIAQTYWAGTRWAQTSSKEYVLLVRKLKATLVGILKQWKRVLIEFLTLRSLLRALRSKSLSLEMYHSRVEPQRDVITLALKSAALLKITSFEDTGPRALRSDNKCFCPQILPHLFCPPYQGGGWNSPGRLDSTSLLRFLVESYYQEAILG